MDLSYLIQLLQPRHGLHDSNNNNINNVFLATLQLKAVHGEVFTDNQLD